MTHLGRLFEVDYNDNDNITTLKEKVRRKKQIFLPTDKLIIWQCREPKLLVDINAHELKDILKKIHLSDYGKVFKLAKAMTVISLKLSKNKILLVQMPGKCSHSSYNFTILIYQ